MRIDILGELQSASISWKHSSSDQTWVIVTCPFHEDSKPSCAISLETQRYVCHACSAKGDFVKFLAKYLKQPMGVVFHELADKYADEFEKKVVDPYNIEKFFESLSHEYRKELHSRGISDAIIRERRIGQLSDRIAIPIKNFSGHYVNVRLHKPKAETDKVKNLKGHGDPVRLYPIDQLAYDTVVITGGELKALSGLEICNKHEIGIVTPTAGEGKWDGRFNEYFRNKRVYIIYDIDEAGRRGAELVARIVSQSAEWLGVVDLPLNPVEFPTGDLDDYLSKLREEHSEEVEERFLQLLEDTEQWELRIDTPDTQYPEDEEGIGVTFSQAYSAKTMGQKIKFKAVISAMGQASYPVPKIVNVKCPRDSKVCGMCRVYLQCKPDEHYVTLGRENPHLLEMINVPKSQLKTALREAVGIPSACKVHKFETESSYEIEDCRISPELKITDRTTERNMQSAYCHVDGPLLEMNESYEFEGRMFPHPMNQKSTILISKERPTVDALSSYQPKNLDALRIFQPKEWTIEGISNKLDAIYNDFAANVTLIFERPELHLFVDLAYHSPLFITFDRNSNNNGWVEVLIVGDTSQGKSKVTANLREHYGLGESVECKGITEVGLKGGLKQLGTKEWYVTWGVIPTNDKGLVILEELKGAPEGVFNQLTYMRGSGIAEITKVEKRKAHARTRLIAISNPLKDGANISSYNYGVEALTELIRGVEDLRRFDACLILDRNQVDAAKLQMFRPDVEHVYTANLCRELILWAWTRTGPQVVFEDEKFVLDVANKLCSKYCDDIPLLDRGSTREKLAKLSASLAARTFSVSDSLGDSILFVRNVHVAYIAEFLDRIYSNPSFGYDSVSNILRNAENMTSPEKIKARLRNEVPYPKEFAELLLEQDEIDTYFIQDTLGWSSEEARMLISFLIRSRAIRKNKRRYKKTSTFTALLKEMLESGELKDRLSHVHKDD